VATRAKQDLLDYLLRFVRYAVGTKCDKHVCGPRLARGKRGGLIGRDVEAANLDGAYAAHPAARSAARQLNAPGPYVLQQQCGFSSADFRIGWERQGQDVEEQSDETTVEPPRDICGCGESYIVGQISFEANHHGDQR
jgi:hypothetical protein